MSRKAAVLHEDENHWSGFLYDKDCWSAVVQRFLKPGELTHYEEDFQTVIEARHVSHDCDLQRERFPPVLS